MLYGRIIWWMMFESFGRYHGRGGTVNSVTVTIVINRLYTLNRETGRFSTSDTSSAK